MGMWKGDRTYTRCLRQATEGIRVSGGSVSGGGSPGGNPQLMQRNGCLGVSCDNQQPYTHFLMPPEGSTPLNQNPSGSHVADISKLRFCSRDGQAESTGHTEDKSLLCL